jgi:hypothetical protein
MEHAHHDRGRRPAAAPANLLQRTALAGLAPSLGVAGDVGMKSQLRYQDLVDQQRAGAVNGVFIDDTGSPGLRDTPGHLHPSRKSWVAVLVPREQIGEVWEQFPRALQEFHRMTGASEFHFSDIYMRRRAFKDTPLHIRLAVFGFMAQIFGTYGFPVFVQTLDPNSLKNLRLRGKFPDRIGVFDLRQHQDLALFLLLLRAKGHLKKHFHADSRTTHVFIDEGYKKNGVAIAIPTLADVFMNGLICFARSDTILPLQLADFAAFCLNRTQLLLGKQKLSELDEKLLQLIEPLAWTFQNIPQVPLETWFPTKAPSFH